MIPAATPADRRDTALVRHAAHLAQHIAGYLADRQLAESGWRIHYAVDADIVGLYLNPSQRAAYANVFGEGDAVLARLIGDYLMREFEAGEGACLFVVPPHDEQIARMVIRVSELLVDEIEQGDTSFGRVTEELARDLGKELDSHESEAVANWLIENASDLIELFDGKTGPAAELARFAELDDDRLQNVERYIEKSPPWAFPLPTADAAPAELDAFAELVGRWRRSLTAHRSRRQPRYSVDEDALVLATVEWLNRQMARERRKILLVTGTSGIWAAAASDEHRLVSGPDRGRRFSEACIRHPQAFMASRDFFFRVAQSDDAPVFNLVAWLNLVFPDMLRIGASGSAIADVSQLPPVQGLADGHDEAAAERHEHTVHTRPARDHGSVIKEWNTQVGAAAVARRIDLQEQDWSNRATRFLGWLRGRMQAGWTLGSLRSDVTSRALKSLSTLYSSTVWLGLWDRLRKLPEQARGIPSLRFEAPYGRAQECARQLVAAMEAEPGAPAEALALKSMFEDLSRADESNYLCHVIHALAYSTRGHWYATRTLCRIALRISDDLPPDSRGNRRGREAAYLLAVAERRLAESIEDVERAQGHLREAEARRDPGAPTDLRFVSEALSQEVAIFNFRRFVVDTPFDVAATAAPLVQRGLDILPLIDDEPLPEARQWIAQQTVTVVLNVGLTVADATPVQAALERGMRQILAYVDQHPICRQVVAADGVADFVHAAATAVFAGNPVSRRYALKRVHGLPFPSTRPYDPGREQAFRKAAERACSAV